MPETSKNRSVSPIEISISGFNALLDAAVDGIIIIDSIGNILNMNQAAQLLFGYTLEDVKNKNVKMLMPEPYKREHDGYLKNYRDTGEARIIGTGRQVHAIRKDSTTFPINLSVGEYEEGDIRYFIGVIHDLTEQVRAERMAQDFRNRLAHVDRVSTMGEMASGIAHELNQPLTAIGSYIEACRRRLDQGNPDITKIRELLEKVESQSIRASKVIERVRSLVRPQDIVRTKVDVNDILLDAIEFAHADAMNRGVSIEENLLKKRYFVDVDTVQIQQVIINLIRNAVDATVEAHPGEGQVTVSAAMSSDSKYVEVQVRDWGVGISREVRKRLFHPFVSSKTQGTGLGLSISQSIIMAHSGKLWAPETGQGAAFWFSLPLHESNGN